MTTEMEPQGSRRRPLIVGAAVAALAATAALARRGMQRTARIRMSITIDRPVHEVFAFVADAENAVRWLPGAVERRRLTAGPVGLGTRYEGTDRIGRRLVSHTQEIIAFEPDRLVTTRMSEPYNGDYEIRLEPSAEGTLLHVDTSGRPSGAMRVLGLLPDAALAKMFERDYARLKALLERDEEPTAIPIEPQAEPLDAGVEDEVTP